MACTTKFVCRVEVVFANKLQFRLYLRFGIVLCALYNLVGAFSSPYDLLVIY